MLTLALAACGDDGDAADPTGSTSAATVTSDSSGAPTTDDTDTDTDASVTTTPADTTDTEPDADTSNATDGETTDVDTTEGDATEGDTTEGDTTEYAALVRGTLFTTDLEEAQGLHDAIAAGGKMGAMALGDFGHDAVLGTTLLGTTENEYVAIDRWTNLEGAMTLYNDPAFVKAFSSLFAEPVVPELFERRADWYGWGDLDVSDELDSHVVVVVRGRLIAEDANDAQELHDQLASAGEATAMDLGDLAHVVWLGVDDPHEFFAVDVWSSSDAIEQFYSNPDLQQGFGMLFDGQPSFAVYHSTDWHQW